MIKVQNPPQDKPLLIYDGNCTFCTRWIVRWRDLAQDKVHFEPFQNVSSQFPEISRAQFDQSVQWIDQEGVVYQGAHAVFKMLNEAGQSFWLNIYQRLSIFAALSEFVYRFIASRRPFFSKVTTLLWGNDLTKETYQVTRSIFLRALGVISLIAFISYWIQADGLSGNQGILPVASFLKLVYSRFGASSFHLVPSLSWIQPGTFFLYVQCALGIIASLVLILGFAPRLALFLIWLFYLSLISVGIEFYAFQWDSLFLETVFFSIFLAPYGFHPSCFKKPASNTARFLLNLLLFKLMLMSGLMKLLSGDPNWQNLTALTYHYWTQPLPTTLAYFANQLPLWFQKFSVVAMFIIELVVPFLIFSPRRLRLVSFGLLFFLQILILLTGNYAFFNYLTLTLCLLLLSDRDWLRLKIKSKTVPLSNRKSSKVGAIGFIFMLVLNLSILLQPFIEVPPFGSIRSWIGPFKTVNAYGLFAVMTTRRLEIIIEGSEDGKTWKEYEFRYKPDALNRAPGFIAPFQPRLDWQLWFAALSPVQYNQWFLEFCNSLLQGSHPVAQLLKTNPFGNKAPKFLRALYYEYYFAGPNIHKAQGLWWQRELKGLYCPILTLDKQGVIQPLSQPNS